MKYLILICLLLCPLIGNSQPEWQFYVPAETFNIGQAVIKPHQALVINRVNGVTGNTVTSFADLPFFLSDSTAISGLSVNFDILDRITISFSTPADGYLPGDVLFCNELECPVIFSVTRDLNLDSSVYVDAIDWVILNGAAKLQLSFSQDFEFAQDVYLHNQAYLIDFSGPGEGQLRPEPLLVADDYNILDNMALTALDSNDNSGLSATYLSVDTVFARETGDVIFPSEFFEISGNNHTNFYLNEFRTKARDISAMMTLDTGWAKWQDQGTELQVSENAGSLEISLQRLDGREAAIEFEVTAINGTAILDTDYAFSNGPNVFWNHLDNANQTLSIDILDNQDSDQDRSFELRLKPKSKYASTAPNLTNRLTITIVDEDDIVDLIFKDGFE